MEPIELPQRAPSLRDQVYQALRRQIRDGTFPVNGVVELDLSETLQVSRTPVREALFQLCREGVLVKRGRGYHLPQLDKTERRDIFELRRIIEPALVSLAIQRSNDSFCEGIRQSLTEESIAHDQDDSAAFIAANSTFRRAFLKACGNKRMAEMMELLDDQVQRLRQATLSDPQNRALTLEHHERIVQACEKGDTSLAVASMQDYMEACSARFLTAD